MHMAGICDLEQCHDTHDQTTSACILDSYNRVIVCCINVYEKCKTVCGNVCHAHYIKTCQCPLAGRRVDHDEAIGSHGDRFHVNK